MYLYVYICIYMYIHILYISIHELYTSRTLRRIYIHTWVLHSCMCIHIELARAQQLLYVALYAYTYSNMHSARNSNTSWAQQSHEQSHERCRYIYVCTYTHTDLSVKKLDATATMRCTHICVMQSRLCIYMCMRRTLICVYINTIQRQKGGHCRNIRCIHTCVKHAHTCMHMHESNTHMFIFKYNALSKGQTLLQHAQPLPTRHMRPAHF